MQQKYAAWGRVKSCIRELTAYGSARKAEIGADKAPTSTKRRRRKACPR